VFLKHVVQLENAWAGLLIQSKQVSEENWRHVKRFSISMIPSTFSTPPGRRIPQGSHADPSHLLNNAYSTGALLGYSEVDRVCVPVPFYHCFGMVLGNLACTAFGACIVVPSEAFQAHAVLETIDAEKCTSLYGVPTMFRTILEDPEYDRFNVSSLRTGIMAGRRVRLS